MTPATVVFRLAGGPELRWRYFVFCKSVRVRWAQHVRETERDLHVARWLCFIVHKRYILRRIVVSIYMYYTIIMH